MKQFKPAIAVIVLMAVVVIGWTAYRESRSGRGGGLGLGRGALMQAATAPPIRAGQAQPHPDWGSCTSCHDVIPAKEAARTAAVVMAAASVAPPLGIWLRPLTPATAARLGLDNLDGVLVSGVNDPSPARSAGLKVGDVITRIDNKKVESVNEALAAIAEIDIKESAKLHILREGRGRKIFVSIAGNADVQGQQLGRLAAAPVRNTGRIAVAATAMAHDARVARVFGRSQAFLVYDQAGRRLFALQNRGLGTLTAGRQAASQIAGARVSSVIVGSIGPGSLQVLRASGIQVFTGAFGPVQQVVDRYLDGRLVAAGGTVIPGDPRKSRVNAVNGGKVALAADGPTFGAAVAPDLSLAPYLIIYDLGSGRYEAIAMRSAPERGTSAIQTAHLIVDRGALAVIAGGISPVSVRTLGTLGVFSFAGVSGGVSHAVEMYRNGGLRATTVPTPAPGGWPPGAGGLTF